MVREERQGFPPFVAGLRQSVLFFELVGFGRDTHQLFAVEQRVTCWAIERAERHRLAAVVAIADGFNDGRSGHGLRLRSGCGRRCGSAAFERADDIDFRRAGLLPGEAHADEQNHETDRAVEGVLQFEKG
jgi:hypothetical protein